MSAPGGEDRADTTADPPVRPVPAALTPLGTDEAPVCVDGRCAVPETP